MNVQDLSKNLKEKVKPCYLVTGDDLYFKKQAFSTFKGLVDEATFDFNLINLTASITADALNVNLQTPPLMSDYRVVFLSGEGKKIDKEKAKAFEEVVKIWSKDPCPNVVLVIDNEEDNFKFVAKYSEVVDCKKQTPNYLIKEIIADCAGKGYKIQDDAARNLVMRCNNDMMICKNELSKLICFADDKIITDKMVQAVVISNIEESVFKLTDKIAQEDTAAAYEIMDSLLSSGEQPLKILAAISSQYRRMFICKVSTLPNSALAAQLGVKEFAVEIAKRTAKVYKPMQLKKLVDKMADIEYQAKSGGIGMLEGLNLALAFALGRR